MTARRQHVLLCRQHVLSAGSCPRDRWRTATGCYWDAC